MSRPNQEDGRSAPDAQSMLLQLLLMEQAANVGCDKQPVRSARLLLTVLSFSGLPVLKLWTSSRSSLLSPSS